MKQNLQMPQPVIKSTARNKIPLASNSQHTCEIMLENKKKPWETILNNSFKPSKDKTVEDS